MHDRRSACPLALAGTISVCGSPPVAAQENIAQIRPVTGLTLVSTLQYPKGDREDVIELKRVDSAGIHYVWRFVEFWREGDTVGDVHERRVRANDLAGAPRLDPVFAPGMSWSARLYRVLDLLGRIRGAPGPGIGAIHDDHGRHGGRRPRQPRCARRLAPGAVQGHADPRGPESTDPFHSWWTAAESRYRRCTCAGDFTDGARSAAMELWVLADSAHPLLLKGVQGGRHVFQMVRVDFPVDGSELRAWRRRDVAHGRLGRAELGAKCRVELPGVYFAFNSARIDPASDRALAQVAAVLARHPDWRLAVEGHTDSVGTAAANQTLSARRAEAVRARLAERHGVDTRRLDGSRVRREPPAESNATIEGRARNRRVELVRACPERS